MNRHRKAIEKMYIDVATIMRLVETETDWGETRLTEEEVYSAAPCRISQKALGTNGQTETVNQIAYETKLFIAPDIDIKQGDVVKVTRQGNTRVYTAGEPFIYPTHQEVSLQRKDNA